MRIRHCSCLHILSISFIPLFPACHILLSIFNYLPSPFFYPFFLSKVLFEFFPLASHISPTYSIITLIVHSFPFYRFLPPKISCGPLHSSLQYLTRPPYNIYFSIYPRLLCSLLSSLPFLFMYISPPPPWPLLLFNVCIRRSVE
jgi:hypothetical protein